jgi:hypothetical protein
MTLYSVLIVHLVQQKEETRVLKGDQKQQSSELSRADPNCSPVGTPMCHAVFEILLAMCQCPHQATLANNLEKLIQHTDANLHAQQFEM